MDNQQELSMKLRLLANGFMLTSYAFEDISTALLEMHLNGKPLVRHKARQLINASVKANGRSLDEVLKLFSAEQGDFLNELTDCYMNLLTLLLAMTPAQRQELLEAGKRIVKPKTKEPCN